MTTRRSLLQAKFTQQQPRIRLPWVRSEAEFIDNCSRCLDCVSHCPEKIIVKGSGGYPEINFKLGECSFCTECVKVCSSDLFFSINQPPWSVKATISDKCLCYQGIVCAVCYDQCESEAILFKPKIGGVSEPELIIEKCTGCGACNLPCPTNAIELSYQNTQTPLTNRSKDMTL